eukprot:440323-Rhodomonas_salina.3
MLPASFLARNCCFFCLPLKGFARGMATKSCCLPASSTTRLRRSTNKTVKLPTLQLLQKRRTILFGLLHRCCSAETAPQSKQPLPLDIPRTATTHSLRRRLSRSRSPTREITRASEGMDFFENRKGWNRIGQL